MDDFKPENELKPDASDRRVTRPHKTSSISKYAINRNNALMILGIVLLLLFVLGIGSALRVKSDQAAQKVSATTSGQGNSHSEKPALSAQRFGENNDYHQKAGVNSPADDASTHNQPKEITVPTIASSPALPVETETQRQQRITLAGDLNSALTNKQSEISAAAVEAQRPDTLPTAPATVSRSSNEGRSTVPASLAPKQPQRSQVDRGASSAAAGKRVEKKTVTHNAAAAVKTRPVKTATGSFTIQINAASQAKPLSDWAEKNRLTGYRIHKTVRNHQPWYLLTIGAYSDATEARKAVALLPPAVRSAKPWIKSMDQIEKEIASTRKGI